MIRTYKLRFLAATCLFALSGAVHTAPAQTDGVLQIGDPVHELLLRQHTAGNLPGAHLTHLPLSAGRARAYLDSLALRADNLSATERRLVERYRGAAEGPGTTWVNGLVPFLYTNGRDFYSVEGPDFGIQVNPMAYLTAGTAARSEREDRESSVVTWQNTRGLRVSGHIGSHVFFETRVEENQKKPAVWEIEGRTAPRLGHARELPDRLGSGIYDYWRAAGMVGIATEYFEIRAGRDRNRWGPGINSVFLSDYAPYYDQLQIRTSFWRIQYANLYTAMEDLPSIGFLGGDEVIPRKYTAMHRLALTLSPRLQIDLFESVTFAPDTVRLARTGFDLSFLNPIIFYRAVEADRGGPDNVHIGAGFSWMPVNNLRTYGQLLLTEFRSSEIFSGRGWFGNKWGLLAGFHATNVGLPDLDVQMEYGRLRPFTFSHRRSSTSFVHYNDFLAHPAGQNLEDVFFALGYRPSHRWRIALRSAYTRRGRNPEGVNLGGDPRLPYTTRETDYGHHILQGIRVDEVLLEAQAGFELLPDLFLEAALRYESAHDAQLGLDRYVNPFLIFRWGIPFQSRRW